MAIHVKEFASNLIFFRFVTKKIYGSIKKNKDDVGNFGKIDKPYFASLKTTQLLLNNIFIAHII